MPRKKLTDLEWVALAVLDASLKGREALTGVHATSGFIEATDGHRLFRTPNKGMHAEGLWRFDPSTGPRLLDIAYPGTDGVWTGHPALDTGTHSKLSSSDELHDAIAVCRAGAAGNIALGLGAAGGGWGFLVGIPNGKKTSYVNPFYLGSALAGANDNDAVAFSQAGSLDALYITISSGREAAIMPVRVTQGIPAWRLLSLVDLLVEIESRPIPVPA